MTPEEALDLIQWFETGIDGGPSPFETLVTLRVRYDGGWITWVCPPEEARKRVESRRGSSVSTWVPEFFVSRAGRMFDFAGALGDWTPGPPMVMQPPWLSILVERYGRDSVSRPALWRLTQPNPPTLAERRRRGYDLFLSYQELEGRTRPPRFFDTSHVVSRPALPSRFLASYVPPGVDDP